MLRFEFLPKTGECNMKHRIFLTLVPAAALALGTVAPGFAQNYNYNYGRFGDLFGRASSESENDAARRWEHFLDRDENQNFARQFRGNPNIIHDERAMDQWTGVRQLFDNHPDVREYVFQKVRDYNENTRPGEKWRRELDANPNFADRYRQNPNIVNDSNLASDEPEINEFLRTNPDVRDYLERQASRSYDRDRDDRDYRND
jgi:hypothetical protein